MFVGFFWQGLPPFVISWAQDLLPGEVVAIETGTFQGDTSALLAKTFGGCTTIERSPALAAQAVQRFAGDPKVTVLEGSSRDRLLEALPDNSKSCFFWLDAHGMYDYMGSDSEENPLLYELATILECRASYPNVIAVDDARGMGTQPDWPPLADVFRILNEFDYVGVIVDDTLVTAPAGLNPDFYALYKKSRTVEVSAVFHIWPNVLRAAQLRSWSDTVVINTSKLFERRR